jgi:hypothetical protein
MLATLLAVVGVIWALLGVLAVVACLVGARAEEQALGENAEAEDAQPSRSSLGRAAML